MTVARGAGLRTVWALALPIVPLAALAALAGLALPGLYRDVAWIVPQNRGQDLVTVAAVAALARVLAGARRGSPRATLIGLGLLGYVLYTYTGAALGYAFNRLFPVYVALFSLSLFALAAAGRALDPAALAACFDAAAPRRMVAGFLIAVALLLTLAYGAQIAPFYAAGTLPAPIALAKTPTFFVYVLDLGVIAPLAVLTAVWLLRRRPWGYVLATCLLVKSAAMGLALLAMTAFSLRAGLRLEVAFVALWALVAGGGLGGAVVLLRHCREDAGSPPAR